MSRRITLILVVVSQLLSLSCSRSMYPEKSFSNIRTSAESRQLKGFLDGGVEKKLNTGSAKPDAVIAAASEFLGVPHCMGGTTMQCVDCSGLLVTVFAQFGVQLPHSSQEQARYGKIIQKRQDLKRGDLVFFIRTYRTQRFITHSGIYLGNSQFIHASSQRGVTITSMHDPYWTDKFIFGTRIF